MTKKNTKYILPKVISEITVNTILGVSMFPDPAYTEKVKKLRILRETKKRDRLLARIILACVINLLSSLKSQSTTTMCMEI